MSTSGKSKKSQTSGSGSSGSLSKIISFSKSVERGSFGVLYAMIKNNTFPKALTIISILIEFAQLCSFGFKSAFPWGGDVGAGLQKVVSPISHPANALGYDAFTWFYYAVLILMCFGIINILVVAWSFYQNKIANIWIIRTLRWFVSFSVAVLYIPIISLFLIPLHCHEVDGTAIVFRFSEDIACYGKNNVAKVIISIIIIVIFSIIGFLSSATYYEYDSSSKERYAKPHARFDLTVLVVKTIFAFFFELRSDTPWALVIIYLLGMLWLCFGSIIFMPYNHQPLNQTKTGFYFTAFWVSLCTLFTMGVNDKTSSATSLLVICGLPFAFAAGFFSNLFFYRWLTRKFKKFQVTNIRTESSNDLEAQKSQSKVTFSQQTRTLGSQKQIIFKLFEKKYIPAFFVEIMARKLILSSDSNDIERVNLFYQCALQYYPKSHLLWMAYCNYLFTVRKDRQIGYAALEKLRRIGPPFDVRFYIYQRDKEREQIMDSDLRGPDQQGKIQDFVSYMEFKKLYNGAKRYHLKCLTYIQRFWKLLLHETIDLHRLSEISGRIASTENKAMEHYERLLALNPNSVRVLRDFSQFLEDVVKDKDAAIRLQKKAEAIEDLMSKSLSNEHIKFHEIQTIGEEESDQNVIPNDYGIPLEKIERGSQHSKSKESVSDSSASSKGRQKRYQEFQQSNSISKLSWLMVVTTFLAMIFSIVILVVLRNLCTVQTDQYVGILSLGDASTETIGIASDFNMMNLYQDSGDEDSYNEVKSEISARLTRLKNIHDAIYYGETSPQSYVNENKMILKQQAGIKVFDVSQRVYSFEEFNKTQNTKVPLLNAQYQEPSVNVSIYIEPTVSNPDINQFTPQVYNAWKAVNLYIEMGILLLSYPYNGLDYDTSPLYRFIIENQASVSQAFLNIQTAYNQVVMKQNLTSTNIIFYIWVGAFALLFILAVFLFRPVVSKITREKIKTLILFSMAPKEVIVKMASKKIKMVSLDSSSDRDAIFDTDDEGNSSSNHHLDDDQPKSDNEDVLRGNFAQTDDESKPEKNENDSDGEIKTPRSLSGVKNQNRSIFGQSGESLFVDTTKRRLHESRKHLIDTPNPSNNTTPRMTSYVLEDAQENQGSDQKPKGKELKYGWDGQSKRNLNKKSLRSILRRLHLSYSLALFFLFGFITMGLFVSLVQVNKDTNSGSDIALSSQRAVAVMLSNYYVSEATIYNPLSPFGDPFQKLVDSIGTMQKVHQSLEFLDFVRPLMDGTGGCFFIDNPCPDPDNIYYFDVQQGMDWMVHRFTYHSLNIAAAKQRINTTEADYVWLHEMGGDTFYDGLDRATFLYFEYWLDVQKSASNVITAVMAVVIVLLLLIYIILYRPFINRLRIQHIHTLALLRLIPDDLRNIEIPDKAVDED